MRIRIRDKRSGREKTVAPRYAHVLVKLGKAEYVVDEPPPPMVTMDSGASGPPHLTLDGDGGDAPPQDTTEGQEAGEGNQGVDTPANEGATPGDPAQEPTPGGPQPPAAEESTPQTPADPEEEKIDYSEKSYQELQELVKARGLEPEGRKKEDLIRALQTAGSGRYGRRDMRAQD